MTNEIIKIIIATVIFILIAFCVKKWKVRTRIANLLLKKYQTKDGIAEMNSAYQGTYESVYKYPPIEKSWICSQSNPLCDLEPTTCGNSIDCSTFGDIAKGERCFICGRKLKE